MIDTRPVMQRILERVVVLDTGYLTPCWIWTGCWAGKGYGRISVAAKQYYVHLVVLAHYEGLLPKGGEAHHECEIKRCCNPDHVKLLTRREHLLTKRSPVAANARKTHCIRNHEFTPENTRVDAVGRRTCRRCKAEAARERRKTCTHTPGTKGRCTRCSMVVRPSRRTSPP